MTLPDIPLSRLDGTAENLQNYSGRVLLVVNVASQCGFTPQYKELEALYRRHKDRGLTVLGFPCNQFGSQEPGSSQQIATFCSSRFDVTFPIFAKCEVNGTNAHPFYRHLKSAAPGLLGTEAIKWNFTKFLIARDGQKVQRFGSAQGVTKLERHVIDFLGG
jgi:glutathione peroxidase